MLTEADYLHGPNGAIVTVAQLAQRLGRERSVIHKQINRLAPRLGISVLRIVTPASRGSKCSALSASDAQRVADILKFDIFDNNQSCEKDPQPSRISSSWGAFYIIATVPEWKRERVKLGYSTSVHTRLGEHRTSAPTAELVKEWPCKSVWEFTATDFITREGCTRLGGENFDCENLDELIARAEAFFAQAPREQV